jgi:hypothetical protein
VVQIFRNEREPQTMGDLTLAKIKLMHKGFYIHVYTSLKTCPLERPAGDRRLL